MYCPSTHTFLLQQSCHCWKPLWKSSFGVVVSPAVTVCWILLWILDKDVWVLGRAWFWTDQDLEYLLAGRIISKMAALQERCDKARCSVTKQRPFISHLLWPLPLKSVPQTLWNFVFCLFSLHTLILCLKFYILATFLLFIDIAGLLAVLLIFQ